MSTGTGPETEQRMSATTETAETGRPALAELPDLPPLDGPSAFALALPTLDDLGPTGVVHEREIRPLRRLRWWQSLPIALLAALGSLMFGFPLAFGSGGAMVGMLGLLLTAASVGWGAMAARHAGYKWPGLPRRGSGLRADWRAIVVYTLIALLSFALAVWRVVHLHG
ncbi:hypothetical protein [Kitasatospora sp. NPDC057223]|uniref:hypothetical protein n=1 Tax=Kitasatospora sp. NPDC057223 TaxID=3346055 RepID=UPI0036410EB7